MNQISLHDLVIQIGQAAVARAIGVTPAAIHKAITSNRNITVTINDDGSYSAQELRTFPSKKNDT